MSSDAIVASHLGKDYLIGERRRGYGTLRESISGAARRAVRRERSAGDAQKQLVTALDDLSFEIPVGETVGFIGHNGAGKSTLLKVLSRVTTPTRGFAEVRGRVGALLEVGTGFHPELTGRENVYLNGAILGMGRGEITSKFDQIVEFADVARFLDTPVKRYSSGMKVRLAFAVAAHIDPEVLVIDEVLAVGDAVFQRKCLDRIASLAHEGRTVLFVSHNMAVIHGLCRRGIVLEHGRVLDDAPIDAAIRTYLQTFELAGSTDLRDRTDRRGEGDARATALTVLGEDGRAPTCGAPATFEIEVDPPDMSLICRLEIFDQFGVPVTVLDSANPGDEDVVGDPGVFRCDVSSLLLAPGRYRVDLVLMDAMRANWWLDEVHAAAVFDVEQARLSGRPVLNDGGGSVVLPHVWTTPKPA
jgi:lipopolysaccharide transport system ATP-binding protein